MTPIALLNVNRHQSEPLENAHFADFFTVKPESIFIFGIAAFTIGAILPINITGLATTRDLLRRRNQFAIKIRVTIRLMIFHVGHLNLSTV